MSAVIDFLQGVGCTHQGYTLADVLAFDDMALEYNHQYIQWLFPLDKPSGSNRLAPILTAEDIQFAQADDIIQENLIKAFNTLLNFWGIDEIDGEFCLRQNAIEKHKLWLTRHNHNQLRISRVIRSLGLLGQEKLAMKFQYFVIKSAYESQKVSESTMQYWLDAYRLINE